MSKSELTVEEYEKLVFEGKLVVTPVLPIKLDDGFLSLWNSKDQVQERESKGLFVNVKVERGGVSISSVGNPAALGVVLFGIAYGAYSAKG